MQELPIELRQIICHISKLPDDFDATADLYRDLGLDSFRAVDLLLALEECYGVSIPDTQYTAARSLEDLSSMMCDLLKRPNP